VQPRENASPALILKRSAGTSRERAARFERIRDRREGNFQLEQARASRTKDVDKYQTYKSQGACPTGGRGGGRAGDRRLLAVAKNRKSREGGGVKRAVRSALTITGSEK